MHRLNRNVWIINSEDDFTNNCTFAYKVLSYVEENHTEKYVRWFFDLCYANWEENNHTVIFKSYITEEFKDHVLSIGVSKENDQWVCSVIKKVAPKVD